MITIAINSVGPPTISCASTGGEKKPFWEPSQSSSSMDFTNGHGYRVLKKICSQQ